MALATETVKRWVAALRSGEYAQGHGSLYHKDSNKYCCLGVLCKIVGAPVLNQYDLRISMPINLLDNLDMGFRHPGDRSSQYKSLVRALEPYDPDSLASMNDSSSYENFEEIATEIVYRHFDATGIWIDN